MLALDAAQKQQLQPKHACVVHVTLALFAVRQADSTLACQLAATSLLCNGRGPGPHSSVRVSCMCYSIHLSPQLWDRENNQSTTCGVVCSSSKKSVPFTQPALSGVAFWAQLGVPFL